MALMPANVSYEEAAVVPTMGLNALHFIRKANIHPGEEVLINGAGGSIGTYAVQLAKKYGAVITAVDSAEKLKMLKTIGTDSVIDYEQEDFTRSGKKYDVIFDVVGKSPFMRSLKILNKNGRYLLGNPKIHQMLFAYLISLIIGKKVIADTAGESSEDLAFLANLMETEKIKSVIDRKYSLDQAADAHRYVETGKKIGNVVISLKH
jgi:NADPH:quinone reductase-like Zn-dependent oxidoreductase